MAQLMTIKLLIKKVLLKEKIKQKWLNLKFDKVQKS